MLSKAVVLRIFTEVVFILITISIFFTLFGAFVFEPLILIVMYMTHIGIKWLLSESSISFFKGFTAYVHS